MHKRHENLIIERTDLHLSVSIIIVIAKENLMAKNNRDYNSGGVAFVGCLVLGFGVGAWFDHTIAGLMSGIGLGFIMMAVLTRSK